ncbi:hypothetical protein UVI_02052080 [Ustilaginoidea virens]|uniref:Pectinesterase n=1 Tax=Ustilaginoidea virens TaxID=1159556 RepID=A0A1B5L339_USTVR|nr:hypothetical protein UVI_02052080 [Ustilaginoidea virens]
MACFSSGDDNATGRRGYKTRLPSAKVCWIGFNGLCKRALLGRPRLHSHKMKSLFSLLALLGSALALRNVYPPEGALVVGQGGHATIQDAVDALDRSTKQEQSIFIYAGTYYGQVSVEHLRGPLTIYGYTEDTTTYEANQVTIVASHSQEDRASNDLTATLRVETSNFKLYNVNVVNSHGKGSQALALSANKGVRLLSLPFPRPFFIFFVENAAPSCPLVETLTEANTAQKQGYYGCSFKGFQDTLLSNEGSQLFAACYIEGATDFVFGRKPKVWFERCVIGVLPTSVGYITASGRSSDSSSYFVFNRASIVAAPWTQVSPRSYYLGRPWGAYARVAFQNTYMSDVVNAAGWHVWNDGDARTEHVVFGEWRNSGPGSYGRRKFETPLGGPLRIGDILDSDYASKKYVDTSYLWDT